MAAPDQMPPIQPLKRQFIRITRLAALFSIGVAAVAVALVAQGESQVRIHILIATALGVGFSVLLGIALMTLAFLSNRLGQDANAADHIKKENDDPRS